MLSGRSMTVASVVVGNRLAVVLAVVGSRFLTLVNGGVCMIMNGKSRGRGVVGVAVCMCIKRKNWREYVCVNVCFIRVGAWSRGCE